MPARSDKLFQKRRKTRKEIARRAASRTPMRRALIVTEGEVTEVEYFEALKSLLKLVSVDLDICGKECDSSPMAVVRYALERADAEGAYDKGGYNDVYCVFDRDTHTDFEKALSQILTKISPDLASKVKRLLQYRLTRALSSGYCCISSTAARHSLPQKERPSPKLWKLNSKAIRLSRISLNR